MWSQVFLTDPELMGFGTYTSVYINIIERTLKPICIKKRLLLLVRVITDFIPIANEKYERAW